MSGKFQVEYLHTAEQIHLPDACQKVALVAEETGYSAFAVGLPGVVSQGETEQEALANIREALAGAIESYLAHGEDIPWDDALDDIPEDATIRWVAVDGHKP